MENKTMSRIRKEKEITAHTNQDTEESKKYPASRVVSKKIKIKPKMLLKYKPICIKRPMQNLLTF